MLKAVEHGAETGATGVLVDEQFGSNIPERVRRHGLKLAMPVEKSGQDEFDFEYGADFPAHIEKFSPDFSKVLVRFNPDGDGAMNQRQLRQLRQLSATRARSQVSVRTAGASQTSSSGRSTATPTTMTPSCGPS